MPPFPEKNLPPRRTIIIVRNYVKSKILVCFLDTPNETYLKFVITQWYFSKGIVIPSEYF